MSVAQFEQLGLDGLAGLGVLVRLGASFGALLLRLGLLLLEDLVRLLNRERLPGLRAPPKRGRAAEHHERTENLSPAAFNPGPHVKGLPGSLRRA